MKDQFLILYTNEGTLTLKEVSSKTKVEDFVKLLRKKNRGNKVDNRVFAIIRGELINDYAELLES